MYVLYDILKEDSFLCVYKKNIFEDKEIMSMLKIFFRFLKNERLKSGREMIVPIKEIKIKFIVWMDEW